MFKSAAATQVRVLHALILRDMQTRFGRQTLGYLWAIFEPLLFVAVFVAVLSLRGKVAPAGIDVTLFIITGILPFFLFRNVLTTCLHAIQAARPLLIFPQVTPFDVVMARTVLEFATGFVVLAIVVGAAAWAGLPVNVERPLECIIYFVALCMLGFGTGATFGALAPIYLFIQRIIPAFLGRPLFWISGVFFTADMIPEGIRGIALYNPILHLIELFRSAFFVEFESTHADPMYAAFWVVVATLLGGLMQRGLRKQMLIAVHT